MNDIDKLLEIIRKRRSCRAYLPEHPVEEDKIELCLEAARLAPSACNKQPWRFIIVKDKELRKKICHEGLLPGIPMPWLNDAPVIVVLCVKLNVLTHIIAPHLSGLPYYMIDAGIAGEHFVLAAEAQGLGTCWIGWFNEKKVKKILAIPSGIRVLSLISLGYPADNDIDSQKIRLSLNEIYFDDKWQNQSGCPIKK